MGQYDLSTTESCDALAIHYGKGPPRIFLVCVDYGAHCNLQHLLDWKKRRLVKHDIVTVGIIWFI